MCFLFLWLPGFCFDREFSISFLCGDLRHLRITRGTEIHFLTRDPLCDLLCAFNNQLLM